MRQDKISEVEFFDELAREYEYSLGYEEDYQRLYEILFPESSTRSYHGLVLDVGCGPGINSFRLSTVGFKVIGVDISQSAIQLAHQRAVERDEIRTTFVVTDVEYLPFKEEAFDMIFCGAVLHHFLELSGVVKEMYRILKPSGQVCSYDPNALNPHGFLFHNVLNPLFRLPGFTTNERALTPRELRNTFGNYGFKNMFFTSLNIRAMGKSKLVKALKDLLYTLFEFVLPEISQGLMLVMRCEK